METVVLVVLGIVFILIGISNSKGNISSLHSYHRNRVSEEDRLPFGKLVGLGMIIIGISMFLVSGLFYLATSLGENVFAIVGTATLFVGLMVGIGISFYAMIKYNKGIF